MEDDFNTKAVEQRCSVKKVFAKSQENTCAGASYLIKKRLRHMCFPVSFAKVLRAPLFTEHLGWLRLPLHEFH